MKKIFPFLCLTDDVILNLLVLLWNWNLTSALHPQAMTCWTGHSPVVGRGLYTSQHVLLKGLMVCDLSTRK